MDRGVLAIHPFLKKRVYLFLPSAWVELKLATSSLEAGIPDCRVRRVGESGSKGYASNSCKQATTSCTHCSSTRILDGLHSTWFLWRAFWFVLSLSAARILPTLWTFLECTSSCFSFWRRESQPDFILLPLFMVHSIHISHAMLEYGLPLIDCAKFEQRKPMWSGGRAASIA